MAPVASWRRGRDGDDVAATTWRRRRGGDGGDGAGGDDDGDGGDGGDGDDGDDGDDVGAKHSDDQFCYLTKIFIPECFALLRS